MRAFAFGLALLAAPAAAQELPSLTETMSGFAGTEVQSGGTFMVPMFQSTIHFKTEDGQELPTKLALGRADLAAVEKCARADNCQAAIKAELAWSYNSLTLIVYEVTLL